MPASSSRSASFDIRQAKRLVLIVVAIAAIVLIGLWWTNVYESPTNVFWGMVGNNLATSGATMHVSESQSGSSLKEYIQVELGAKNLVYNTVNLNESGTEVNTETIGTPVADYTRYTDISSRSSAKKYKNIVGIWARSAAPAKGQTVDPLTHLFGQTVLSVVPFANLSASVSQALVRDAQTTHVYTLNLSHVSRTHAYGHSVYVFTVGIAPQAYSAFMQKVTEAEGLGSSSAFNPASYSATSQPLSVQLSVDPVSRQLVAVNYGNGHTESVSTYGYQPVVALPAHTISTNELQSRLETVSQ